MELIIRITSYHRLTPDQTSEYQFHPDKGGSIGRSSNSDWLINDAERIVSGQHATISFRDNNFFITDTSTNGLYINGSSSPLGRGNSTKLSPGDTLKMGEYEFEIELKNPESQDDDNCYPPIENNSHSFGFDSANSNNNDNNHIPDDFFSGNEKNISEPTPSVKLIDFGNEDDYFNPPEIQPKAPEQTPPPPPPSNNNDNVIIPDDWNADSFNTPFSSASNDDYNQPSSPNGLSTPENTSSPASENQIPDDFLAPQNTPESNSGNKIPDNFLAPQNTPESISENREQENQPPNNVIQPDWNNNSTGVIDQNQIKEQNLQNEEKEIVPEDFGKMVSESVNKTESSDRIEPNNLNEINDQNINIESEAKTPESINNENIIRQPSEQPIQPPPITEHQPHATETPITSEPLKTDREKQPSSISAVKTSKPAEQKNHTYSSQSSDSELVSALIDGLGINKEDFEEVISPDFMRKSGEMLKDTIQGLIEILRSRSSLKSEFRASQTTIRPVENNPLKFAPTFEDAMYNLFVRTTASYLAPIDSVNEAIDDIKIHQVAMLAGFQGALKGLLEKFSPENIIEEADKSTFSQKSKYWEHFCKVYKEIQTDAEDNIQKLLGEEFTSAYEKQCSHMSD